MQRSRRILPPAVVSGLLALAALSVASANAEPVGGPVVAGTWEHRHASFHYDGITSLYSCAGLETNIRALLQHLGARKDLAVHAYGCLGGYNAPGRSAIVDLDFYSLAAGTAVGAANSVQARWTPVTISANHPNSIGDGDCELIHEMKDILSKNFSLRALNYRTDCRPGEVNINDFSVKAEMLQPLPVSVASAAQG
jgi:hypothetical protein